MADFQKDMINILMGVDCPNCGIERLSTAPYPATVGDEIEVRCGHCGGVGNRTMPGDWQYTDINAWPLEQRMNKRYPRGLEHNNEGSEGQLQWD